VLRKCRHQSHGLWDLNAGGREWGCDRDEMRGYHERTRDQAYFAFENCRQGWEVDDPAIAAS
jgi:hypothetical protein